MGKLEHVDDLTQNPDVPLDSSLRCELYYTELNDGPPFVFNMSRSVNKALRLKYFDLTRDAFATNALKVVNFPVFQEGSADEASHCQRRGSSVLLI